MHPNSQIPWAGNLRCPKTPNADKSGQIRVGGLWTNPPAEIQTKSTQTQPEFPGNGETTTSSSTEIFLWKVHWRHLRVFEGALGTGCVTFPCKLFWVGHPFQSSWLLSLISILGEFINLGHKGAGALILSLDTWALSPRSFLLFPATQRMSVFYNGKEDIHFVSWKGSCQGIFLRFGGRDCSWLQPSWRIGSAHAAVLGCSFLVILVLHSPLSVVWVSKLHLSLKNMEWELHMEQKPCPAGKASLITVTLCLKGWSNWDWL